MSKEVKNSETLILALTNAGNEIEAVLKVAHEAISVLKHAENELCSAQVLIDEQSEKIDAAIKSNPDYRPEVSLKKGTVRINHAVRDGKGNVITIDEIAQNPKLIEELLKAESTAVSLLSNI